MMKLMGYDYSIHYRKGKENATADALSRRSLEEGLAMTITAVEHDWVIEVLDSYKRDKHYELLI